MSSSCIEHAERSCIAGRAVRETKVRCASSRWWGCRAVVVCRARDPSCHSTACTSIGVRQPCRSAQVCRTGKLPPPPAPPPPLPPLVPRHSRPRAAADAAATAAAAESSTTAGHNFQPHSLSHAHDSFNLTADQNSSPSVFRASNCACRAVCACGVRARWPLPAPPHTNSGGTELEWEGQLYEKQYSRRITAVGMGEGVGTGWG